MLDFRIRTFLQLCETMNYRKTASIMNMTQPAVTQHIQYLEKEYGCSLFEYDKRKLKKTEACLELEQKVRAALYMEQEFIEHVKKDKEPSLTIGATKTIAEFVLPDRISNYLSRTSGDFTLLVDNTEHLIHQLDQTELDFALIEGFFDKSRYGYRLYKKEEFIGVCAKNHPFANKHVSFEEVLTQELIIREEGSGTRSIFEDTLKNFSHTLDEFKRIICISHFPVIRSLLLSGQYITFAYASIIEEGDGLAKFYLKDVPTTREFNYVFLKGTHVEEKIKYFQNGNNKVDKSFLTD